MILRICLALLCIRAAAIGATIPIDSFNDAEVSVSGDLSSPTKKIKINQPVESVLGGTRTVTIGTFGSWTSAQPTAMASVHGGALEVDSDFTSESFRLEYGAETLDLDVRGMVLEVAFNSYLPENTTTERTACFIVESFSPTAFHWNASMKCVPIQGSAAPFLLNIPVADLTGLAPAPADLRSVDRITFALKAEPVALSIDSLRLVPEASMNWAILLGVLAALGGNRSFGSKKVFGIV